MNETIETSEEFMNSISPDTRIIDLDPGEAVVEVVARYGRRMGADQTAVTLGVAGARLALRENRSAAHAIGFGMECVDEVMKINAAPITSAWSWLQGVGAENIGSTPDGVAGHVKINGHWYTVMVEAQS